MDTSQNLEIAIDIFRNSSLEDRTHFLCELSALLHPSERSLLYRSLVKKGFGYDILGHLPHELVLKVVVFLEVRELFLFQNVCKRWRQILSSESVVNIGLQYWFPRETDSSRLVLASGPNKLCELRNLAFREQAAAGGLLLAGVEVLNTEKQGDENIRSIILRAGRMAVVTSRRLLVLSMNSVVSPRTFLTPSRESIARAAIGPSHVAALTFNYGTCHVWNLQGEHIYKWRLTSGNIQNLEVSEKHVVAISSSISEMCFHILDIKSLRPLSFSIPWTEITPDQISLHHGQKQTLLVDEDKNQLVLLRTESCGAKLRVFIIRICSKLGRIESAKFASKDAKQLGSPNSSIVMQHWHSVTDLTEFTATFMQRGGELVSCYYSLCDDSLSWVTWEPRSLPHNLGDNSRFACPSTPAACHGMIAFILVKDITAGNTHHNTELVVARNNANQRDDHDKDKDGNQDSRRVWKTCNIASAFLRKIAAEKILEMLFDGRFLIVAVETDILVLEVPDYDAYRSAIEKAE